jgi:hypothetical protein
MRHANSSLVRCKKKSSDLEALILSRWIERTSISLYWCQLEHSFSIPLISCWHINGTIEESQRKPRFEEAVVEPEVTEEECP